MQRWVSTLVGLAAVALALWLVAHNFRAPKARGHAPGAGDGGDDAGAPGLVPDGGTMPLPEAGSLFISDLPVVEARPDAGPGATLADGTPVPPLPLSTPRQVRFGVVLVTYAGAQPSVAGLSEGRALRPSGRSKSDARLLATKLAATAEQDFHAAVQQGDGGSADDVGRVKLGILEPAPEYVLFTLPVGGVGGPVDTPRGYWIVKRLE